MARVLVTGMSGAGKSTLLEELRRRGHCTVDTDYDGWVRPDGTWDEPRMSALLDEHDSLVVAGTVENQARFYDRFDHVVLLSAPISVLLERVRSRTDNPYGRTAEDQSEIRGYVATVEPLLRRGATLELDGRRSVRSLADAIEGLAGLDDMTGLGAQAAHAAARLQEERAVLIARVSRLDDDMAALIAASRDSNADDEHDPEGQTIAYERSQLSAVTSQARDHLREIVAALERVASGTYGVCEVCRRPIDAARLEARPTARACVQHAQTRRSDSP